MKGRIDQYEHASWDIKRPVIIPRDRHITHLIVIHYHNLLSHQKYKTVISEICQNS